MRLPSGLSNERVSGGGGKGGGEGGGVRGDSVIVNKGS